MVRFGIVAAACSTQNPARTGVTRIESLDRTRLTTVWLDVWADQVNQVAQPIDFDCSIDDVFFYK
jgi:hypothetical protein